MNLSFEFCDFKNTEHRNALVELLNHYMVDPMGDFPPHEGENKDAIIHALDSHPTAEILFAKSEDKFIALTTVFSNLSTFYIKPYFYIHDVVVLNEHRGKGVGQALLSHLIHIAKERDYCKLTLEVRTDNPGAQKTYKNLGFKECEPSMLFWERKI